MLKYILWDHDGVLVDTEKWYFKATQRALSELSISLDEGAYLEYMKDGKSCWELALQAGITEQEISEHRSQRDVYYQIYLRTEDIEIPGVEQALQDLAEQYEMAIVTTSRREDFELIHQNRNITRHMDFVLTVEDYPKAKPAPDPYLTAIDRFNANPEEAIIIEDSERGLKSAVAAGIDCIIIHNDFTSSHDFTAAKYLINSIRELPDIIAA